MIDKALIIVIFFYAAGFFLVGLQFTLADLYGFEMVGCKEDDDPTSPTFRETICTPLKSNVIGYLQLDNFNERTDNIQSANYTGNSTFFDKIETFTTGAAFVAWELVTLMSGTYIFYIMLLLGVPSWIVTMMIGLYILLLARAILGYVRGI